MLSFPWPRRGVQEVPEGILAGSGALVTGGSRGIGAAIVERLAKDGARVVFSYAQNKDLAGQLVARLAEIGAQVHAVAADVGGTDAVRDLFDTAMDLLGGLDILVNNAGQALTTTIADTTEQDFDRLFAINVKGPFFLMQQAARRMSRGGRVINISTINTVMHGPGVAVYAATKAAVEQFTLVAAKELGLKGITVNTVSPGPIDTDMLRATNSATALDIAAASTPLRRLGQPDDVADVVAFLAGPGARWLTGQNLRASGGLA